MKTLFTFCVQTFILTTPFVSFSKDFKPRTIEEIISQKEVKAPIYRLKTGLEDAIVLPMPYGEPEIVSESDKKKLKKSEILRVELVFSDFPKHSELKDLNMNRIHEVERLRKDLVTNPLIEWKIIRQTSCLNESEAKTFFHGIVIHTRAIQSEETKKEDLSFIKKYLDMDSAGVKYKLPDSTIFKVFKRNSNWNNMLVVSDLTGSMSPYTTQLILWFKLNAQKNIVKDFVFFNDGDRKKETDKVIGNIGGVYHSKASTFDEIAALANKTIQGGNGGDAPENNIEAILKGIEVSPKAKDIILIADNFANIKDFVLSDKINKPIRIILCGTQFGINPQYLDLARKAGGSVHTMEEDLTDLIKKNEGEMITFNKRTFQIIEGTFVEIKKV